MNKSEQINELAAALAKAQMKIRNAELDRVNPHFKNRYATLGSIINAVKIPLAEQGLATMQTVRMDGTTVVVSTMITHSSGQWIEEAASFPLPERSTVQQLGSCVTYLRRYSLSAICGIVGDEDDDGEGDRVERAPEPRREPFKPTQARGAEPQKFAKPVEKPAPKQQDVAAAPGEWVELAVRYIDEGVAGKNQAPYVKLKDSNGDNYFVWDVALHGVARASKGATIWVITEPSKQAGAPPRVVQIRTAPPAEPSLLPEEDFDEQA
jgi:hypothetical protein